MGVVSKFPSKVGLELGTGNNLNLAYTGTHTDEMVTIDGQQYRLLTLTSSGTLTADKPFYADLWECDGGDSGTTPSYNSSTGGKGADGAKYCLSSEKLMDVSNVCVVGSGGATIPKTSSGKTVGGVTTLVRPSDTPSTAVGGAAHANATGTAVAAFETFANLCGAGGGGGNKGYNDVNSAGSGVHGGGNGGTGATGSGTYGYNGTSGQTYGSGGGGGGAGYGSSSGQGAGGAGYQGVVMIRIQT